MKMLTSVTAAIWAIIAIISVAQHEWYQACLEGLLACYSFASALDE